jgi:hypothetical protein
MLEAILSGPFSTILTPALFAIGNAGTIKYAADNMIPNTRQIPDPAATNHNRAVLLQIVVDTWYVGRNFLAVG